MSLIDKKSSIPQDRMGELKKTEIQINKVKAAGPAKTSGDTSIFGGKTEISREELRQKLRTDSSVWKKQVEAGLSFSPEERVKLEKELPVELYGDKVSKGDLRSGIERMRQKKDFLKSSAEREQLDRKIKLLKKIGGL